MKNSVNFISWIYLQRYWISLKVHVPIHAKIGFFVYVYIIYALEMDLYHVAVNTKWMSDLGLVIEVKYQVHSFE